MEKKPQEMTSLSSVWVGKTVEIAAWKSGKCQSTILEFTHSFQAISKTNVKSQPHTGHQAQLALLPLFQIKVNTVKCPGLSQYRAWLTYTGLEKDGH